MRIVVLTFHRDELAAFAPAHPSHDFIFAANAEQAVAALPSADVLVASNRAYTQAFAEALTARSWPELKLIHFTTAGIDNALAFGLPGNVPVTNASGVKTPTVSEHALALLLTLVHRMPQALAFQAGRQWARDEITPALGCLQGRTACVIGLGPIGRAIARKLAAFDVTVTAVSRGGDDAAHVARLYPRAQLHEALSQSEIVVLATHADAQTTHMIDAAALAAMPRGSLLINIARGSLVDTPALIAALQGGHLAGAGLDVAHVEPLPADDPLWCAPNLVLTPHIAGAGSDGVPAQVDLLGRILSALAAGAPLPNCLRPASAAP